jgi:hypothetical protein
MVRAINTELESGRPAMKACVSTDSTDAPMRSGMKARHGLQHGSYPGRDGNEFSDRSHKRNHKAQICEQGARMTLQCL